MTIWLHEKREYPDCESLYIQEITLTARGDTRASVVGSLSDRAVETPDDFEINMRTEV